MKRNHTILHKVLSVALVGLSLVSCAIKENRTNCPCWLNVDVKESLYLGPEMALAVFKSYSGTAFNDYINIGDYPEYYSHELTKGEYVVSAYVGQNQALRKDETKLIIPLGSQSDSLWISRDEVECVGESAYSKVQLHRQFARVFVKIEGADRADYPYTLVVKSNVEGIDIKSLRPLKGEFMCEPLLGSEGTTVFTLPRLFSDSPLTLKLLEGDEVVQTIDLAEMLVSAGYSWLKTDLDDIQVTIDYAEARITIKVRDWRETIDISERI